MRRVARFMINKYKFRIAPSGFLELRRAVGFFKICQIFVSPIITTHHPPLKPASITHGKSSVFWWPRELTPPLIPTRRFVRNLNLAVGGFDLFSLYTSVLSHSENNSLPWLSFSTSVNLTLSTRVLHSPLFVHHNSILLSFAFLLIEILFRFLYHYSSH